MEKGHKQVKITSLDNWAYDKFRRIEPKSIIGLNENYVSDTDGGILIINYRASILWMGIYETGYEAFNGLGVGLFMIGSAQQPPSLLRIINFMQWTDVDFLE